MTKDELIKKADDFVEQHKFISWKPKDFPEDMTEGSTLAELGSQGNDMYYALKEAIDLIDELMIELEFK